MGCPGLPQALVAGDPSPWAPITHASEKKTAQHITREGAGCANSWIPGAGSLPKHLSELTAGLAEVSGLHHVPYPEMYTPPCKACLEVSARFQQCQEFKGSTVSRLPRGAGKGAFLVLAVKYT